MLQLSLRVKTRPSPLIIPGEQVSRSSSELQISKFGDLSLIVDDKRSDVRRKYIKY
jgi:hypothetical protein